jgi:hypothetical protein
MPAVTLAAALLAAAAAATPIPQGPNAASLPAFSGRAATPRPLSAPAVPRHPHMAPNQRSNIHDDAYQSDVNRDLFTNFAGGQMVDSAAAVPACARAVDAGRRTAKGCRAGCPAPFGGWRSGAAERVQASAAVVESAI